MQPSSPSDGAVGCGGERAKGELPLLPETLPNGEALAHEPKRLVEATSMHAEGAAGCGEAPVKGELPLHPSKFEGAKRAAVCCLDEVFPDFSDGRSSRHGGAVRASSAPPSKHGGSDRRSNLDSWSAETLAVAMPGSFSVPISLCGSTRTNSPGSLSLDSGGVSINVDKLPDPSPVRSMSWRKARSLDEALSQATPEEAAAILASNSGRLPRLRTAAEDAEERKQRHLAAERVRARVAAAAEAALQQRSCAETLHGTVISNAAYLIPHHAQADIPAAARGALQMQQAFSQQQPVSLAGVAPALLGGPLATCFSAHAQMEEQLRVPTAFLAPTEVRSVNPCSSACDTHSHTRRTPCKPGFAILSSRPAAASAAPTPDYPPKIQLPLKDSTNSLLSNGSASLLLNLALPKRTAQASPLLRTYSMEEVARHNNRASCWLVAHGKVYDVTPFLEAHPAGTTSIMRHAGTDATRDFEFHSHGAQKLWDRFHIGYVRRHDPGCAVS